MRVSLLAEFENGLFGICISDKGWNQFRAWKLQILVNLRFFIKLLGIKVLFIIILL